MTEADTAAADAPMPEVVEPAESVEPVEAVEAEQPVEELEQVTVEVTTISLVEIEAEPVAVAESTVAETDDAEAEVEATVAEVVDLTDAGSDDDASSEEDAPEPVTHVIDLTDDSAGRSPNMVDDLFARLRAARTESVAHAVEVLSAEAPAESDQTPSVAIETAEAGEVEVGVALDAFATRKAATELLERSVARHLKRALADEQNDVLERLRQARSMPALDELLGDLAEHAERYRGAVADDLRSVAVAGARSTGVDERAAERFGTHARVRDAVLDEVGMELTGLIRDRVGRCLTEGQGDPDEAAHQLRAAYREMKVQRLDALAAHFTVSAYARGAFAAIPVDAKVCWLVDPDGPACADAEDNQLAGAIDHGAEFPTGHHQPPAHLGCRCHVVAAP